MPAWSCRKQPKTSSLGASRFHRPRPEGSKCPQEHTNSPGLSSAGAGSSRARPEFYVPNGKPKCLCLRELRRGARELATASPLLPEHSAAVVDVTSGKMPLPKLPRRNLMEVLRKAPDPRRELGLPRCLLHWAKMLPDAKTPMFSPTSRFCAASACFSIPATVASRNGCRARRNALPQMSTPQNR